MGLGANGYHREMRTIGAPIGFVVHSGPSTQMGRCVNRLGLAPAIQRVIRLIEDDSVLSAL